MIWPWYALLATLALIALSFVLIMLTDSDGWLVLLALGVIAAIILLVVSLVISVGRHYGRVNCSHFSVATHRQTRFVIYSTFQTDCLTPDGNGRWIPIKNLREFGSGS